MPEQPLYPLNVKVDGRRLVPAHPENCEPHTPAPADPFLWLEWFEEMTKSHVRRQCRGCGLRDIWEPVAERAASPEAAAVELAVSAARFVIGDPARATAWDLEQHLGVNVTQAYLALRRLMLAGVTAAPGQDGRWPVLVSPAGAEAAVAAVRDAAGPGPGRAS